MDLSDHAVVLIEEPGIPVGAPNGGNLCADPYAGPDETDGLRVVEALGDDSADEGDQRVSSGVK